VAKIESREQLGSADENLTEDELVARSKAAHTERKTVLEARREEARAEAKQEKELREKLERLVETMQEELTRTQKSEDRLFLLLEKLVQ
jgi:hypothetical protein